MLELFLHEYIVYLNFQVYTPSVQKCFVLDSEKVWIGDTCTRILRFKQKLKILIEY